MLVETVDEIVRLARSELSDEVAPYLWSDLDMYIYASEACDALAIDTDGLYALITLPVVAGTAVVPLPAHVRHIRSARLVSNGRAVIGSNVNSGGSLRADYGRIVAPDVFDTGTGTPSSFVGDYDPGAIRLLPIPAANDSIELQCTVTLEFPLELGDDMPFLDSGDQRLILTHMKVSAYSKHDAETEDLARAGMYARIYKSGAEERAAKLRNYRRAPGVVRMEYM